MRDHKRTVGEYLDDWLERKRTSLASKTYQAYFTHVDLYVKPALGELRLSALRKEHVRQALSTWSERKVGDRKIAPRTVHHVFSTLRTAMHDALDDGAISVLPFGKRMTPKKGAAAVNALDESEIITLLEHLDGTALGPPTRLAVFTGLRRGELLALRWEDIDFDHRLLRVRRSLEVVGSGADRTVRFKVPKTEKSRRDVALSARAIVLLRSHHAKQSKLHVFLGGPFGDEELVFPNPRTGEPWKPDTFSNEFFARVKTSGLPKVTFHGLRHSYASISLRAGTPLKVVSEMLGHTTVAITADLYTHVLGNLKAEAADRLDAIFDDAETKRAAAVAQGSWAKGGSIEKPRAKKVSRIKRFEIAPAGFEPALPP